MIGYSYLIAGILVIVGFVVYCVLRAKSKSWDAISSKIYKVLSLALAIVFFFRYMWENEAIKNVIALNTTLFSSPFETVLSGLGAWFSVLLAIVFCLYGFFSSNKGITNVIKYFVSIIAIFNFSILTYTTIGICGEGVETSLDIRAILLAVEVAIELLYCIIIWIGNYKFTKWTGKQAISFVLSIIGLLLASIPAYIPQLFFGYINIEVVIDDLSLWHRIYVYFGFIIPILIYIALKNKDYGTKKFALLFLSLATLTTFMCSQRFATWTDPTQWPIHLCHTAMYIIPLCLIFNWNKLFYFSFFINVLGAFFAMIMPDCSGNMICYNMVRFWINHYMAFFMPLLLVGLKMFKRPKLKEFIFSAIAFSVYFFSIIVINAWFSNYGKCDFFFVNSDFIAEKLGKWAEDLRLVTISFSINDLQFILYPLYQILFYLTYIAMSMGMWFIYEQSYNYFDLMTEMNARRKKYKLEELALMSKLNGRSISEPLNIENKDKLILHNFTKRYGTSEVYAVKDANLEVHAGEIFGFLGPNGAGKSTIIKSIVGIQPITGGSIEVCGYDVDLQSIEAKKQIGFVPDHYALYEKLTGREYINYIADIYEVSEKDRKERIEKYVSLFQLEGAFDNQMKTYSHGMKQKIAIMSALVHNPKVWILDEPLTGLDPNSIFQVKECMKQHAQNGNIVFFSSHIIDVVERICDRIGIIKKGQIQLVTKVQDILDRGEVLEDFYMNTIENSEAKEILVDREIIKQEKKSRRESSREQHARLREERNAVKLEKLRKKKEKLQEEKKSIKEEIESCINETQNNIIKENEEQKVETQENVKEKAKPTKKSKKDK